MKKNIYIIFFTLNLAIISDEETDNFSKQNFNNDNILELIESTETDYNLYDFSILNSLRLFTMPEILSGVNAYVCEKCCVSIKNVKY